MSKSPASPLFQGMPITLKVCFDFPYLSLTFVISFKTYVGNPFCAKEWLSKPSLIQHRKLSRVYSQRSILNSAVMEMDHYEGHHLKEILNLKLVENM